MPNFTYKTQNMENHSKASKKYLNFLQNNWYHYVPLIFRKLPLVICLPL